MKCYVIIIFIILLLSLFIVCSLGDFNIDEEIIDEFVIDEFIEVKVDGIKMIYVDELWYVKEEVVIINLLFDLNKSIVLEDVV